MGRFYAYASHILKKAGVKGKRQLPVKRASRQTTDVFAAPGMPGHYFGGAGTPGMVSQAIFAASQKVTATFCQAMIQAQGHLAELNQTALMAAQVHHG